MKKLLIMLSAVGVAAAAPTTVVLATQKTSQPNIDAINAANTSKAVANTLIQKGISTQGLNSQQFLQYEENTDPNAQNNIYNPTNSSQNQNLAITSGLNRIFGQHTDLTSMVNSDSNIKDTDSKTPGKSLAPNNILAIQAALQALSDSKNINNPSTGASYIADAAYLANLPQLLGQVLDQILGPNNIIAKILGSAPISPSYFINALNTYKTDFGVGTDQYIVWDTTTKDGISQSDSNSNNAFDTADADLSQVLLNYASNNKITSAVYPQIASYVIFLLDYISQFSVQNGTGQVGDNMYSKTETNEAFRASLDASKVQAINWTNLGQLIYNVVNFDNNNGLGIAQLLDILFGSETTIGTSKDYYKTNLVDLKIVPDLAYQNPIISFVQGLFSVAGPQILNKFISNNPVLIRILDKDNVPAQLISLIGGLIDNIATNRTIDDQYNMLTGAIENIESVINESGVKLPTNIQTIMDGFNSLNNQIVTDHNWISLDDSFVVNPNDLNYDIYDSTEAGHTWDDMFNGKISFYGNLAKYMNTTFTSFGVKNFTLPSTFDGLKSVLDNLLSKKLPGTDLTFDQLLQEIDEQGGIVQYITSHLSDFANLVSQLYSTITNTQQVQAAQTWIKTNVKATSSDTVLQNLINTLNSSNGTLLDALSIISIASSKNELANGVTSTSAKNEFFEIVGYNVATGQATSSNTIYGIISTSSNWTLISGLIDSLAKSGSAILKQFEAPFSNAEAYWKNSSVSNVKEDSSTKDITYTLTDDNSKKSYDIKLVYNTTTNFYTIDIS